MKLLLLLISIEIALIAGVTSVTVKPDPKTCNRGRCGNNPCAARGLSCCFCDEGKTLNIDACFCCPKNHSCCPVQTWAGNKAHCCPNGYTCSKENRRCTKQVDIKPEPADGLCGFNCRPDTEIYVTVDDKFSLLIDGVLQTLKNANDWKNADVIPLKGDAEVITICAENDLYKAGILLSSALSSVLEDAEWKCYSSTNLCKTVWSQPNFDDSLWQEPYEDEKNDGEGTRKDIVEGIPEATTYKWSNNPGTAVTSDWDAKCTCRIKLKKNNGY